MKIHVLGSCDRIHKTLYTLDVVVVVIVGSLVL